MNGRDSSHRAWASLHGAFCILGATTSLVGAESDALAAAFVVQNDALPAADPGFLVNPFQMGDTITTWLTSPVAGDVTAIRIFWRSGDGTAPPTQEGSLSIRADGTFPTPGPELVTITTPTFIDGAFNEFVLQTPVPVEAGETFVVALTLANTPADQLQGPGVVADTKSCSFGVYSSVDISANPSFNDLCSLGFPGNLVMRAIVDDGAEPVPAASVWGMVCLAFLVLTAGTLLTRPRPQHA